MKKRKWIIVVLLLILLLLGAALAVRLIQRNTPEEMSDVEEKVAQEVANTPIASLPTGPSGETEPDGEQAEAYVSPVDFDALHTVNEDIYAWLYIPGTGINYPLVQKDGNDDFYLKHNSRGENDRDGALFTQGSYNNTDFTDPVTVIYGHHLQSGEMFGNLQQFYSSENGLEDYRTICVYLPDQVLYYAAFAAVPYDSSHILYYHDFSDETVYQKFLDQIRSTRDINANVDGEMEVTPEDQTLILSTCLIGNNQRRYLVLAKRTDDRPTIPEAPAGDS